MTAKLLFHLDTDPFPSVFDTVVAYDGGADHVQGYGGVTPENVGAMVDGAIFTRPPKDKRYTALFISGSNLEAGQELLTAVRKKFFAGFRVSVMLDSNGSNTTAAAMVAQLAKQASLAGKKAVVLAGTGPVGQRAGVMMAREGAEVVLTSRRLDRAEAACGLMKQRFGVDLKAAAAADEASTRAALDGAHLVLACGAAAVELLPESIWADHPTLEMLSDANATPPLGFGGIDMMDKGEVRHGKVVFGAIGVGQLKLSLHRACIARLFESHDKVFDAEEIYAIAKTMA
jgi:methylenetetrahydrofolate/methylenetetrahydromethanopterin dehydrogenase (NADP+)